MIMKTIRLCLAFVCTVLAARASEHLLKSPDGHLQVRVTLSKKITYSIEKGEATLILPSPLGLVLSGGDENAPAPKLREEKRRESRGQFSMPWGRRPSVDDNFNELELRLEGDCSVVFRAYDEGIAYRFRIEKAGEWTVRSEECQWNLPVGTQLWLPTNYNTFSGSFEALYARKSFADLKEGETTYAPVLVEHPAGPRLLLADSDLSNYPGLHLAKVNETNRCELRGAFARYPKRVGDGGWCHFDRVVRETEDFIAQGKGVTDLPWRVTIVADDDKALLASELILKLGRPCALESTDWIKTGLASWEWWNDWRLDGVDFKTGINTETYRHFIDFAARHGIPYLVVDEGWTDAYDMALGNPALDLPAVLAYAKQKGVRLVLWCTWKSLSDDLEMWLDRFASWGVAGVKVDFFDRDDQVAVADMERIAREAARRHLTVDFHGCRPLGGLSKTYPNIVNFEGVLGNEYNKFSKNPPHPTYNATLPFTRGLMAPMDFTPGAMRSFLASEFTPSNTNPGAIGTRTHQAAMYLVFDSPVPMLCDSPSAYEACPAWLEMVQCLPGAWDEYRVLDAMVGGLAVVARRKGEVWYLGALGGSSAQSLSLPLDFLGGGTWKARILEDGLNAERMPADLHTRTLEVDASAKLALKLAPGGGAFVKFVKK